MYHTTDTEKIKQEGAQKMFGESFYFDLLEIEPETMLEKSYLFFSRGAFP